MATKVFFQRIDNDVWIRGRVTILGNTLIEDGSVIAGCTAIRDVPTNTLVGGIPTKVIRNFRK